MAKNSVDILIKARDEASKKFGAVGNSAAGLSSALKKAAIAAGAYFSGRAIKNFLQSSLESYSQQEAAVIKLGAALDLLGKKYQTRQFENFASQMQEITTLGDETVLNVMALGASMGKLSGSVLQEATKAAVGLSRAYNMELEPAMTLISKAAQGNTSALGRYGIILDSNLSNQEKFAKVLDIGVSKFKLAQAETKTFAGAMQQMRNAVDDVKEEIGRALAPTVIEAAQAIKRFADTNKEAISRWAQTIMAYVTYVKDIFGDFVRFLISDFKDGMTTSLNMTLTVFKGFGEATVKIFKEVGSKIAFEMTKGVIAGATAVTYFSTKGVIDGLVGAALDGTTFKEHIKNTLDYGRDTADTLMGDMNVNLKTSFKEAGDIFVNAIVKAGELLPKSFVDGVAASQIKLQNALGNINTGAYSQPATLQDLLRDAFMTFKNAIGTGGVKSSSIITNKGTSEMTESRFLTLAPKNNYYSQMQKFNQQTAQNTKSLLNLIPAQEKILQAIRGLNVLGGAVGVPVVGL